MRISLFRGSQLQTRSSPPREVCVLWPGFPHSLHLLRVASHALLFDCSAIYLCFILSCCFCSLSFISFIASGAERKSLKTFTALPLFCFLRQPFLLSSLLQDNFPASVTGFRHGFLCFNYTLRLVAASGGARPPGPDAVGPFPP